MPDEELEKKQDPEEKEEEQIEEKDIDKFSDSIQYKRRPLFL